MLLRKLSKEEVEFTLEVTEDDMPIVGNALASGDNADDAAYEQELLARRAGGDIWAWAMVRVIATWRGFRGVDDLGGCTYESTQAFREDAYYEDMKARALENLQQGLQSTYDSLSDLVPDEAGQLRRQVAEYEEVLFDDGK